MIALLMALAASAGTTSPAVTTSPAPSMACQAAEYATRDQWATMNIRSVPGSPPPGPLGRKYLDVSDRLAAAMKADRPDLKKVEALWKERDRLMVEIGQRMLVNKTACTVERLRVMAPDKQKEALRMMAPLTKEERARAPLVRPAPPPQIPRADSGG